ncbi:MAG: hypothetical protein JST32_22525 [Bacteroidetes bacterium]|nr:hypothetical protein [Bacteroidota bacterium]
METAQINKTGSDERYCEHCGKVLYGRTDQRFCNDTCRNTFNRNKSLQEKQAAHENLPEIFRIIKRNYEILKGLGPLGPDEGILVEKGGVKDYGIDPRFFTSIYIDGDQIWRFCFERGWWEPETEKGGWEVRDRPGQAEIN